MEIKPGEIKGEALAFDDLKKTFNGEAMQTLSGEQTKEKKEKKVGKVLPPDKELGQRDPWDDGDRGWPI